jgi:hypothetical protein
MPVRTTYPMFVKAFISAITKIIKMGPGHIVCNDFEISSGEIMTSKVRVNMFPCENKTDIEVRSTDDGDYAIIVTSTCPKAEKYVNGLGTLSLTDLTDKKESKIFRDFIASDMSANCLVLPGVLTAAWVEAGMIAKSMTKKGIPLAIEFVNDDDASNSNP